MIAHPWKIDIEHSAESHRPVEVRTGTNWGYGLAAGLGLNYYRALSNKVDLRAGLSEQLTWAFLKLEHPYPYMMNMDVNMYTRATRLLAGVDYKYRRIPQNSILFVGGGLYSDILHHAQAQTKRNYISGFQLEEFDMKEHFPALIPGFQIQAGLQGRIAKAELRYWEDIKTFALPTVPVGRQKRSGFGISISIYLRKGAAEKAE
ncbi:MAG: hypothetical protein U1B83_10240 [Candidatus Cloacimonadaceae bacterium]|nr:hypothetical protein [Candidatus Cloacimonadaceae bacterium]